MKKSNIGEASILDISIYSVHNTDCCVNNKENMVFPKT